MSQPSWQSVLHYIYMCACACATKSSSSSKDRIKILSFILAVASSSGTTKVEHWHCWKRFTIHFIQEMHSCASCYFLYICMLVQECQQWGKISPKVRSSEIQSLLNLHTYVFMLIWIHLLRMLYTRTVLWKNVQKFTGIIPRNWFLGIGFPAGPL